MFRQRLDVNDRILMSLNDPNREKSLEELCELLNSTMYKDEASMEEATSDLGAWVGDYLQDAGYNPHTSSAIIKQMIMTAMPPINDDQVYSPENLETCLLRSRRTLKKYEQETGVHDQKWRFSDTLGKGSSAVFYS